MFHMATGSVNGNCCGEIGRYMAECMPLDVSWHDAKLWSVTHEVYHRQYLPDMHG
jgi:hypothetical protein